MAINLLALTPHQVSRDLKGKIVTIYGEPKSGKTTNATMFPKSLLIAFEKGYNALSGIHVQPVTKWLEFKQVLKELAKPEVKQAYGTIVLDTADIAFDACEKFICTREGVDQIGDIPYGAGYKMLKQEFNDALRYIPMLDYGLVNISHSMVSTFVDDAGQEYSKTVPTLPKAARHIVLSMSDIIGYAKPVENVEGERKVALFLRGTPQFEAGSRFKHTPQVIPFEYNALVNAIADAIEKEAEEHGSDAVTDVAQNLYEAPKEASFTELKADIDTTISELMKDKDETQQTEIAAKIKKTIEDHLGKGKMLKDTNEDQRDHIELILGDLKELLNV